MQTRNFRDLLEKQWSKGNFISIGLDPVWDKIPSCLKEDPHSYKIAALNMEASVVKKFCKTIVEYTHDLVCSYKPNAAFFEAMGDQGREALEGIIEYIHDVTDVPVIYDAKRGDIDTTNVGYVQDAFEHFKADAVTVHPYMGQESLRPFLDRKEKGIIVLCRTSNKGGGEFQDLGIQAPELCLSEELRKRFSGRTIIPLYQYVAHQVSGHWNKNGNCAVVVGATCPQELSEVRRIVGDLPILIPGIGAQGGDVEKTVKAGKNDSGEGMIINSSRSIIYASRDGDFGEAARQETIKLRAQINQYR